MLNLKVIQWSIPIKDRNELLSADYEKMSLISEIMLRKFLRQFKTKPVLPP